jgi:hypothetical protein
MDNDYSKYSIDYVKNNPDQDYSTDWNEIGELIQEEILKYPYLDYEKYLPLLKDKSLLYAFNKKILNDLDWDNLTQKQKNYLCHNNINFEYEKYWDKLTNNQKYTICLKNENFNYEKYWDTLDEESRTVIIKKNDDFDFLKYWDKLSLEQCFLAYMKTLYIEEYQENKILQYLKENSYHVRKFIFENLDCGNGYVNIENVNIDVNGRNIGIEKIKLLNLNTNIRPFVIKYLRNVEISSNCIPIKSNGIGSWKYYSIDIDLEHIVKYNDMYIYKGLLIDDFKFVLREEKLKRIFNI